MLNPIPETLTKEELREFPLLAFEGEIHVIETEEECDDAISELRKYSVVGFDTEKKPTFKKGEYNPTAMVQLSTENDAYLFRMNKMGYPESLFDFMSDDSFLKLGISIDDDLKDLQKVREYDPAGFTDMNDIAKELGSKHIGVKKLAAIFLEHRISKNQQTSNWENDKLTEPQMKYAATDAWICLEIYNELKDKGMI
ncbi:MAG: 3'-5' exonuclease [Ekhidna sp.]